MEDDKIILGGKIFYANNGIIGIDASLTTYEGYDGHFGWRELTKEQKEELADIMIKRWQDYRDKS